VRSRCWDRRPPAECSARSTAARSSADIGTANRRISSRGTAAAVDSGSDGILVQQVRELVDDALRRL
jgi:hypothetical protein